MARNFEFAFLGPHNSYFASVTGVAGDRPIGRPVIELYGLPATFCEKNHTSWSERHFFNLRGHDYLSHMGQWKCGSSGGHSSSSDLSIREIHELRALPITGNDQRVYREADLIVSFGPTSGSFFANLISLKRYRWANLPAKLENEIQNNVSKNGYGKIREIAMNSDGGWIIQYQNGRDFQWGGQLPARLHEALSTGKKSKAAIASVHLNHQNPDEYVLLFKDGNAFGHAYISLHYAFQSRIECLIKECFNGKKIKNFDSKWHFISSTNISEEDQKQSNAVYYSRRGLFHLSRGNPGIALEYLQEALMQDGSNLEIRDNHIMALIAVHRHIQGLPTNQAILNEGKPNYTAFRKDHWTLNEIGPRLRELEDRLGRLPIEKQEWSYEMALGRAGSWLCIRDGALIDCVELPGSDLQQPSHNNNGENIIRVYSHELGTNEG